MVEFQGCSSTRQLPAGQLSNPGNLLSATARGQDPLYPLHIRKYPPLSLFPQAWTLSGDHYSVNKGDRPWISEMYGYSYAASKSDVWHHVDHSAMLYPGYNVKGALGGGWRGRWGPWASARSPVWWAGVRCACSP